jgi:hypothetical protein
VIVSACLAGCPNATPLRHRPSGVPSLLWMDAWRSQARRRRLSIRFTSGAAPLAKSSRSCLLPASCSLCCLSANRDSLCVC